MANVFALTQRAFRFYEDGTEAGASAIAAENANITRLTDADTNLLLRVGLQESGAGSISGATTDDFQLQVSKNGGAYANVTSASSNVKGFASANLTDAGATTQLLSSGSGAFVAGEIAEDGLVDDRQITANNFTEMLYAITVVAADTADGDTLDFRVLLNGATITYSVTPRITVDVTHTVDQQRFIFCEDSLETHANALVKDANGVRIMALSGTSGCYADTPDSVPVSITGDIDIRIKVRMNDWTPSDFVEFVMKDDEGSQRAYGFLITNTNVLRFFWSTDGSSANTADATAGTGFTDGELKWIRVTMDVDNGAGGYDVKFYTSSNGSSWSQLGATVTGGSTTSIFNGNTVLSIGANAAGGRPIAAHVHYAEVRNGIGGSVVAKFDPATDGADAATTITASTGEVWTLRGTNVVAAQGVDITRRVISNLNSQLLLRVGLQETNGGNGASTDDYQLRVSKNGGAYADVTTSSTNVKAFSSVALTDGNTTTNILSGGSGSFVAGEISEDGLVDDRQLTASNNTEHLYTISIIAADVADTDTLDFRVVLNGSAITYTDTPRITVAKTTAPVTFTAGAASRGIAVGVGVY